MGNTNVYISHEDNRIRFFSCDAHEDRIKGTAWWYGRRDVPCQFCAQNEIDRAMKLFRKVPSATNYLTLQTAMLQYQDATLNHRED